MKYEDAQVPPADAGRRETPVGQRTAWFEPAKNPARRGAYEVCWDYGDEVLVFYNRWDGRRWHWGDKELDAKALSAYAPAKKRGNPRMIAWRGVAWRLPNV